MKYPSTENTARLIEVFSSIQGEGTHVGQKHIFVRFEECHMHCTYCDELGKPAREWQLEELLAEIERLEKEEGPHSYVSLTGGEPLMYLAFIKPLIRNLKVRGMKVYLETSGVLWKALRDVLNECDVISMDMKAPSVTKEPNFDTEHKKFLEIAKSRETFVKIVVSEEFVLDEYVAELEIIRDVAPHVPLILMPLSTDEIEGHENPKLMEKMNSLAKLGRQYINDVRIVPRLHKILQIR